MSSPESSLFSLYRAVGTGLYTGYVPLAPGTAASTLCIAALWLLPAVSVFWMLVLAAGVIAAGIISAKALQESWGDDPGRVTVDEIAGMLVALIGLPKTAGVWLCAFLIFRILDIYKPPPLKTLEYLPGGLGVMMDDIGAGIYANVSCWIIVWIT